METPETPKPTPLAQLGEFGLIEHLTAPFANVHGSTILGIGDDAAILSPPEDQEVVISTDMLVEGVHFDMMYTPLRHLGYKAVCVNASDICAMNARPTQLLVSFAASSKYSVEALEEIYTGMRLACEKYQIDLVGGDTTTAPRGLVLSITCVGFGHAHTLTRRFGARPNDLLVVSGDLGGAYLGLQVLEREKSVFREAPGAQPNLTGYDYVLERQLKPEARLDVVELLEQLEVLPTAMIDISDGLASEVLHLCKASNVGCRLMASHVPLDPQVKKVAEEFHLEPLTCALNGGEDYELLFTISPDDYPKIKGNPHLTVIGYVTDRAEGANLVLNESQMTPLKAQGWNAFGSEQPNN